MAIVGERYEKWTLLARLGRGLAGEVWKAKSEDGDLVAIKIYTNPNVAALIRRIGLPDPPLRHRHIADVLHGDLAARPPFIVSEFVPGHSVRELLTERTYLPVSSSLSIFLQMVRALAHAHDLGFAHWNLRPENILVDGEGRIKMTDFQMADLRKELVPRLLENQLVGQDGERAQALLPYMPPEQKRGRWEGVEADAYALGVVLYEMTTGKLPAELDVALRYPSRVDKRIPKIVDEICLRCMERQPRARFHDMEQLEMMMLQGLDKAGFIVSFDGPPETWVRRRGEDEEPYTGEETGRFTAFLRKFAGK